MFFLIIIEIHSLQNENKIGIVIHVKKPPDGAKQIFTSTDTNHLPCDSQREAMAS